MYYYLVFRNENENKIAYGVFRIHLLANISIKVLSKLIKIENVLKI